MLRRATLFGVGLCLVAAFGTPDEPEGPGSRPQTIEQFLQLNDRVRVIAHRGFSGEAPENTVVAVRAAIKAGADMAEIDVTLTADDQIVCLHDEKVNRTTNGRGRISDLTLSEAQRLDAGFWFSQTFTGERIPTLDAVLEAAKNNILLNIEIKPETVERGITAKVVEAINKHQMQDLVIISSFSPVALAQVHALDPDLHTASLFKRKLHRKIDPGEILREAKSSSLNINRFYLSRRIRERCQELAIPIAAYNANSRRKMEKLIDKGVHSIFTDYPDLLVEVLAERTPSAAPLKK
jgi:glycerophosphoryl diester phosphodiesterase